MPEAWGYIIARKLNSPKIKKTEIKTLDIIAYIFESTGIDHKDHEAVTPPELSAVQLKSDYIGIEIEDQEWFDLSSKIVKLAKNLEFYASVYDEYGTTGFFALNPAMKNGKFGFIYDEDGDESEQDGFEAHVKKQIERWKQLIPDTVTSQYKDFT